VTEERTRRMPTLEKKSARGGGATRAGDGEEGGRGSHDSQAGPDGRGGRGGGDPERSASAAAYDPGGAGEASAGTSGRFWSVRRATAGIVSLLLLAGVLLLLYDLISVRSGRPAMTWRRTLADGLADTSAGSGWVIAGAVVAALVGLWLILLAATPGQRRLLPMRSANPGVRAGLDRQAAELALRDRAMEVPGVHSVRVRVSRRKAKATAQAHFRDLDEVRDDLDGALGDGIRQLGLARGLGLSVHVRRPRRG
jgi:hypothetical protein